MTFPRWKLVGLPEYGSWRRSRRRHSSTSTGAITMSVNRLPQILFSRVSRAARQPQQLVAPAIRYYSCEYNDDTIEILPVPARPGTFLLGLLLVEVSSWTPGIITRPCAARLAGRNSFLACCNKKGGSLCCISCFCGDLIFEFGILFLSLLLY